MILHKILKPFLWILTGCRFDFFGISAGTALSVGVGAAGALGNGLASSSAGRASVSVRTAPYPVIDDAVSRQKDGLPAMQRRVAVICDSGFSIFDFVRSVANA